jgi:hypothetical protein
MLRRAFCRGAVISSLSDEAEVWGVAFMGVPGQQQIRSDAENYQWNPLGIMTSMTLDVVDFRFVWCKGRACRRRGGRNGATF